MRHITNLCFDLDDTLWDLAPVIPRAEQALYSWFTEHCPRVTEKYSAAKLVQMRLDVARKYPELIHDLTELRTRVLRKILVESGYSEALVPDAFEVFQKERNSVSLYADVRPALLSLAKSHRLLALTNGNANLHTIGISDCFEAVFTARELGVAKPDSGFFQLVMSKMQLDPAASAHIGDHPENDIAAAARAGLTTVWMNRKGAVWVRDDCNPDHELTTLVDLPELLQR